MASRFSAWRSARDGGLRADGLVDDNLLEDGFGKAALRKGTLVRRASLADVSVIFEIPRRSGQSKYVLTDWSVIYMTSAIELQGVENKPYRHAREECRIRNALDGRYLRDG